MKAIPTSSGVRWAPPSSPRRPTFFRLLSLNPTVREWSAPLQGILYNTCQRRSTLIKSGASLARIMSLYLACVGSAWRTSLLCCWHRWTSMIHVSRSVWWHPGKHKGLPGGFEDPREREANVRGFHRKYHKASAWIQAACSGLAGCWTVTTKRGICSNGNALNMNCMCAAGAGDQRH